MPSRLTEIERLEKHKARYQCSCGNVCVKDRYKVSSGHTTSCGCRLKEIQNKTIHGMHESNEYHVWEMMKQRCLNPKNKKYSLYGGRGIKVCEKWLRFEGFYEDMGERPKGRYSLERINGNGNYEPSNCKWATYSEQARNTTQNHYLTYDGKTLLIVEWAERLGWDPSVIRSRINYRWTVEEILTTPKGRRSKNGTRSVYA